MDGYIKFSINAVIFNVFSNQIFPNFQTELFGGFFPETLLTIRYKII